MNPLHRVDSINDALLTNNKYDHVIIAYLPSGELNHAYRVYHLAAMKNKGWLFNCVRLLLKLTDKMIKNDCFID